MSIIDTDFPCFELGWKLFRYAWYTPARKYCEINSENIISCN